MQSLLWQKKGGRQEAGVAASVLLTSKTCQHHPARGAHTGEMRDQTSANAHTPADKSLSPGREAENKGTHCQFHFPGTAEPTICTAGCPADQAILPLAALPRHPPTRISRASRGRLRPVPRRRHPRALPRKAALQPRAAPGLRAPVPGTLEYSWASFWYFPCSSAAAAAISAPPPRLRSASLGWARLRSASLGSARALRRAPHAREWEDALPGSGRRKRDDVIAPCARRGGRSLKPPAPPS